MWCRTDSPRNLFCNAVIFVRIKNIEKKQIKYGSTSILCPNVLSINFQSTFNKVFFVNYKMYVIFSKVENIKEMQSHFQKPVFIRRSTDFQQNTLWSLHDHMWSWSSYIIYAIIFVLFENMKWSKVFKSKSLLCIVALSIYIFLGSIIFVHIERPDESNEVVANRMFNTTKEKLSRQFGVNITEDEFFALVSQIEGALSVQARSEWTYRNTVDWLTISLTTIGM